MSHDFALVVTARGAARSGVVVEVFGDFDAAEIPRFERGTADLPAGAETVVVNLVGATLVDSSGLGALVRLRERCVAAGAGFRTLVGRPFQRTLMTVTGLTDFLNVVDEPPSD